MSIHLTKNQKQILTCLQQQEGEISSQQLYLKLRQQGWRIGLATVYRTLKYLHVEGIIQERVTPSGESLYCILTNSSRHHHHLNCVRCGQTISIDDCPIGKKISQWCQSRHFKVYYHILEFFGLCDACQKLLEE